MKLILWMVACTGGDTTPDTTRTPDDSSGDEDTTADDDTAADEDTAPDEDSGDTTIPGPGRLVGDLDLPVVADTTIDPAGVGDEERYTMILASVGDVDGDGATDVMALDGYDLVGVFPGPLSAGALTSDAAPGFVEFGGGYHPGGVGDVTGDGMADIAVGGSNWYVHAGPFLDTADTDSAVASLRWGAMLPSDVPPARVGDLDGDGIDDLAVASRDPVGVYVFAGPVSGALDASTADVFPIPLMASSAETHPVWIGDADGDGREDLFAIGLRGGSSGTYSSYSAVWTAPGVEPLWSLLDDPDDLDAVACAAAADFNGDGAMDLALGAPGRDGGRGRVAVYQGPLAGVASVSSADGNLIGAYDDDGLGTEIAAGDLDGDGFADLAMTSHGDRGGSVWLLYGPAPGGDTPVQAVAARLSNPDGQGVGSVELRADITGDGLADLLVGSWYPWVDLPRGWVISGGSTETGTDLDRDGGGAEDCDDTQPSVYEGAVESCDGVDEDCDGVIDDACAGPSDLSAEDARARVAGAVAYIAAGDVDADGVDDLVVSGESSVWLHPGAALAGETLLDAGRPVWGGAAHGMVPGDVDGDGRDDLAVASGVDLHIVFDVASSLEPGDLAFESDAGPVAGTVVSRDITGDGARDLLVGVPIGPDDLGWGSVRIFAGPFATGTLPAADVTWSGGVPPFAAAPALGDVDGDGVDDLLTGMAYGAYLLAGPLPPGTYVSEVDATLTAQKEHDEAGTAAVLGDIDGDGYDDVLVGAPGADHPGNRTGAVYIVPAALARGTVDLGSAPAVFVGEAEDRLGTSLVARDLDGDGSVELVVGAPAEGAAGRVYVLPTPLSAGVWTPADAHLRCTGDSTGDPLGQSIVPLEGGFATASTYAVFAFDLQ